MRVWLPFVIGGSGTDTFTRTFAAFLNETGHDAVLDSYTHSLQYVPDLLRLARIPEDVDIVFTNSWAGFAFARRGTPMVTMEQLCVHDPAYGPYRSLSQATFHDIFVKNFEQRTFQAADRVVAVSEATRSTMLDIFPDVDPIVIHNGVDTGYFTPAPNRDHGRGDRPFRLLFVGNLSRRKGADLLPEVVRLLGPDYELLYTSGLRDKAVLEAPYSRSLGRLDREGVRQAMRKADAFLFPTRLEGFPLSVLEAMACGLPIVGSNASSMPEVVEDGVSGLLCNLDPADLARAVQSLADDQERRQSMGLAGRRRAVEHFSMKSTVERYLSVFEELIL